MTLRVGQYQLGATEVGMQSLCDILEERREPESTFLEYAEVVGSDLNEAPIEAGFPRASWTWERLSQTDYNILVGYLGTVYIRTRNNTGGGSEDYTNYSGVMARPQGTFSNGEWVDVTASFFHLETL